MTLKPFCYNDLRDTLNPNRASGTLHSPKDRASWNGLKYGSIPPIIKYESRRQEGAGNKA